MKAAASRAALIVIDVQERLLPAMAGGEVVVTSIVRLLKGAALLDVPVLASEQYRKGLGPMVAPLAALLPDRARIEKIAFSCADEPRFVAPLEALGRNQVVLAGIEAHVCVLQTALDLKETGYHVFVVADAVASRVPSSRDAALARLARAGIHVVTTEMVLFEWLGRAGTDQFKQISALVK